MTLLITLGTASFVFVAVFTYRAYYATHSAGQSPRSSIAEAWMNIVIGFGINFMVNMALLPVRISCSVGFTRRCLSFGNMRFGVGGMPDCMRWQF